MSEPVEKLPGRSEIDTTASKGKMVIAISAINPICAAMSRQRWLRPVTMAMSASPHFKSWLTRAIFRCASDSSATMKKIIVEMAAARPKFWPESWKAMR